MSHSPLTNKKKLYKIITIPSVKKSYWERFETNYKWKKFKKHWKKIEIIVHKPTTLIIPYVLTDMKKMSSIS